MNKDPKKKSPGKAAPAPVRVAKARGPKARIQWDAIERAYVEGEDGQEGGRTFPSMNDLAKRFSIAVSSISRQAKLPDSSGKTWDDKRHAFLDQLNTKRNTALVEQIVNKEVAFRDKSLSVAELLVAHCSAVLTRGLRKDGEGRLVSVLPPDTISKIGGALKNAQAVGLVAMDRPEDGKSDAGDTSDWTLMRLHRAGKLPGPAKGPDTKPTMKEEAHES